MELLIAGDLVPTESNIDLFVNAEIEKLLGNELFSIWKKADYRIINLEAPLVDFHAPIDKWGPNLSAPEKSIIGIKKLNPSLITLANNHILDHGAQGFYSTQKLLNEYNIPYLGAGENLSEAAKPYILDKNGIKIGFYACAENEFTIASDNTPGANPFDPLESLDHINKLKEKCDYVIVLYHGGKEHYRYPSPYLQKVCRKIVEKGANLVVCQHSHCVGAYEKYKKSTIIYGQGNFIFNRNKNEFWNNSLLIKVSITDKLTIDYIPIIQNKNGIKLADSKESENILSSFFNRSREIKQEGFVKDNYTKFAEESFFNYLRVLAGFGKWKSRIDRKLLNNLLLKRKYKKEQLLAIQNYIECEAHRELMINGLISYINKFNT